MKLIALGSGGWIPTEKRQTACYLIDTGESVIILDSGSGLSRLGEYMDIINKYNDINIIYSHYHLDHLIGISYIGNWSREKNLNIYGPGKAINDYSCREVLEELVTPPYFPMTIDKFAKEVNIIDYDLKGFNIGNINIKISEQMHTGKSFGITIGDYVHYASDTAILENSFIQGEKVKLLLHECWSVKLGTTKDHCSFEEINNMINQYKIEKLGLIHINPNWKEEEFKELYSFFNIGDKVKVVEDKMIFEL